MINPIYINKLVSINLSCQAVNTEYSLIAEQITLLIDAFEKKIKGYTKNQLLFLKACLSLHKNVEQEGINSLAHYQVFLIEERLKHL